ncbi:hypothetical protein HFO27_00320 [Rhizobium leguminosarum]|uniref:hypothetical protein n=1 Tax=Rhizobium leguminosarum TaxID=384 RepID=UPI001C919C40|nr:hypothetical protein [Rhizobium leguminosarum]MBY3173115.1 hypothetical protein [Rhizobium leguminosarum]
MQKHSNGGGAVLIGVPVAPMPELYWGPLAPFKIVEAHDEMVKAIQGRYQFKDPQDVITKVYKFLTDMKFFENLDAFADHAISLDEAEASGQIH